MTQEPYMYGGQMNSSSGYFNHQYSSQSDINHSSNYPLPIMLPDHELALNDLEYAQQVMMLMNKQQQQQQNEASSFSSGSVCSSSYLSSPSSLASYSCCSNSRNMHRSESIHSFQKSGFNPPAPASASSPAGVPSDSDDLQQGVQVPRQKYRAGSPLSSPKESSLAIIEGMSKAQRYSPEEKKERIERYKSKRNQRNFSKKIQYACRKSLADSRPRVKGRFARNDDTDNFSQNHWGHTMGGYDEHDHASYVDDINWNNLFNTFSSNLAP